VRGVVLVDHGSRSADANAQLDRLAELIAARLPDAIVKAGHMELAAPSLGQAIDACVAAGATQILVHPFFIAAGRHVREDVPRQVAEAGTRHPGLPILLTEPLGLHPSVVDAVLDRIGERG